MKGKKIWAAAFLTLGAVSLAGMTAQASDERVSVWTDSARIYMGTLDSQLSLTTYAVDDQEDVPYVSVKEYLTWLYSESYLPDLDFGTDGTTFTITRGETAVTIDTETGQVMSKDWDQFQGRSADGALPNGILLEEEYIAIRPSEKNEATETEPRPVTIDLSVYGLECIPYGDDVLMSLGAVQDVFAFTSGQELLSFNGSDYYMIETAADYIYGSSSSQNPYADKWFHGPFSEKTKVSEAYAAYNYGTLCLMFDLGYGHKDEKGIIDFDSWLEGNGMKEELLSCDISRMTAAITKIFDELFDSGHDGTVLTQPVFDSAATIDEMEENYEKYGLMVTTEDLAGQLLGALVMKREYSFSDFTGWGTGLVTNLLVSLGAPREKAEKHASEAMVLMIAEGAKIIMEGMAEEDAEAETENLSMDSAAGTTIIAVDTDKTSEDAETSEGAETSEDADASGNTGTSDDAEASESAEASDTEEDAEDFDWDALVAAAELMEETEEDEPAGDIIVSEEGASEEDTPLITLPNVVTEFLGEAFLGDKDWDADHSTTTLTAASMIMMSLKPDDYPSNFYDIQGDTAIIYFEEFSENISRGASFYLSKPTVYDFADSTYALFYHAFQAIEKRKGVKNVVINLANNGGGSAAALVAVLGFLSPDGEVNLTYQDTLNQNYVSEWYHVDTNLDGEYDDHDGYGGDYNFYIVTTPSSYSCGNALPYFAQVNGWAEIIGALPGGGDCVVSRYADTIGNVAQMSGNLKLGTMTDGSFTSDEYGVTLDHAFPKGDYEMYYDDEKIISFVRELAG